MIYLRTFTICLYTVILTFTAPLLANPIVGICGDFHGNVEGFEKALRLMNAQGVTHVIGTGDFIGWGDAQELDGILAKIKSVTGVSKDKTFLMPGNWEHKASIKPAAANKVLSRHGHLIATEYDSHGFVEIEGKTIMVSHFPQHPVPTQFIPDERFLVRRPGQVFILDTMDNNFYPPKTVEFAVFAHSHIRAHYVDPYSEKLVINAGVLDHRAKAPDEERAFAIYNGQTGDVTFYSIDRAAIIAQANTSDTVGSMEVLRGLRGCTAVRTRLNAL